MGIVKTFNVKFNNKIIEVVFDVTTNKIHCNMNILDNILNFLVNNINFNTNYLYNDLVNCRDIKKFSNNHISFTYDKLIEPLFLTHDIICKNNKYIYYRRSEQFFNYTVFILHNLNNLIKNPIININLSKYKDVDFKLQKYLEIVKFDKKNKIDLINGINLEFNKDFQYLLYYLNYHKFKSLFYNDIPINIFCTNLKELNFNYIPKRCNNIIKDKIIYDKINIEKLIDIE